MWRRFQNAVIYCDSERPEYSGIRVKQRRKIREKKGKRRGKKIVSCSDSGLTFETYDPKKYDWRTQMFVINLSGKRGMKRRKWIEQIACQTHIKINYVNAVDKEKIDFEKLDRLGRKIRRRDGHRDLSSGEIALSMSHRKIYKHILNKNIQLALIAEDDIELCDNFLERLQQINIILKNKNIDFHVIKLEMCNEHLAKSSQKIKLVDGQGGACTACYIVSNAGARVLVDANTPIWMNSDGIMDAVHLKTINMELKIYHIEPPIARQKLDFIEEGSHHE